MEAVKAFNAELSSLYEVKPPISKAKMTAITRGAIKAIKFYKHVVQSVEKFILKCKPEYKVPGLYVIDSIVRQSRHQFGSDKDVFAPRFAKNIQQTFVNLFKCPPEDKSKIIRVLNLWQKNQVFAPEVIQPLFDLANPNHPIHKELSAAAAAAAAAVTTVSSNNGMTQGSTNIIKGSPALQKSPTKVPQQGADASTLAHLGGVSNNPNMLLNADPNVLAHLQQLHRLLVRGSGGSGDTSAKSEGPPVHFDRKLLDFDYGEDEEEPQNPSPKITNSSAASAAHDSAVTSLLSNPEVLRHLQTLQQSELDLEKLRKLQEMKQQEEEFDKHLAQTVPNLPFAAECEFKPNSANSSNMLGSSFFIPSGADLSQPPPGYNMGHQQDEGNGGSEVEFVDANDNGDVEVITLDHVDSRSPTPREERYSRRRRSRSRDRRRSRRSRSRSHSRSKRHRSRSRERERERERERDKEKDREKEKERKKRGLPPIKKDNLSVCSTTLWVGHLSKLVHQEELFNTFGEFGDVVSIDLIPPRGCAFIVMHRRQDAARCLTKLKNHKLQGKAITLAWAPGKGVKGKDLKDYWEGDLGVSYIPWSKIKPDIDLELLEDGGMIDEDTMPAWLKAKAEQMSKSTEKSHLDDKNALTLTPNVDTTQPPPPAPGLLAPPAPILPLVNPFNSLLGMNIPPGMMPNVPIGVPPPNMPSAPMINNPLLGLGSPFSQGPPPPGMLPMPTVPENKREEQKIGEGVLSASQPFLLPEDSMDVEMEDANKTEGMFGDMHGRNSLGGLGNDGPVEYSKGPPGLGIDMPLTPDNRRDRRDDRDRDRGRRSSRSRDRGRDRDRSRRGSRDRAKKDDRRDSIRDRPQWNDHDRRDRDERRERSEKSVNDRLWEMAEGYSSRDRPRELDMPDPTPIPPLLEKPDFPPLLDKPDFPPLLDKPDFPPLLDKPEFPPIEDPRDLIEQRGFDDRFRRDFDPRMRHMHDDFPPMQEPMSEFNRRLHHDEFEHERFGRRDRQDDFIDQRIMRDEFEGRGMRGHDDIPEFFPPPRDGFGPPPPLGPPMRGPDNFPSRNLPRGPPGPRMFHPRGPLLRGPRPGPPWMEGGGGGMRHKFQPRFEGPGDFFRGPPGPIGPPGIFEDAPHLRHRRYEDRRRHRQDFDQEREKEHVERPSRWGTNSPHQNDSFHGNNDEGSCEENVVPENHVSEEPAGNEEGNTTPLRDEPQEPAQSENLPENAVVADETSEQTQPEQ